MARRKRKRPELAETLKKKTTGFSSVGTEDRNAEQLLEVFPGGAFQKRAQLPGTRWMPQFTQRLGLDLADAFTRDREGLPDFF